MFYMGYYDRTYRLVADLYIKTFKIINKVFLIIKLVICIALKESRILDRESL